MRLTVISQSQLGLGLAALGRPGYINLGHAEDLDGDYNVAAMESHCHAVLDTAWAAGIRYFDAARSYGRAEQFLSRWLIGRHIALKASLSVPSGATPIPPAGRLRPNSMR